MSESVRTEVPTEFYEWMRKNAPLAADTSDSALVTYWLQFAYRQHQLQAMRAAGQYPPEAETRLDMDEIMSELDE